MSETADSRLKTNGMLPSESATASADGRVRRFSASGLFGKARELVIEHGGDEYRLRITHSGKLILTK
ncbi:MAG TPA: hemin uptake protein HemP [Methylophilaceae bacterium]|nr:hemin uptake protein HemP [Methylophilaceae bacterium]